MSPTILEGTIILVLVGLLAAYAWLLTRLWRQRRNDKRQEAQQSRLLSKSDSMAAQLQNGAASEPIKDSGDKENVNAN
jgi:hypothetical protein